MEARDVVLWIEQCENKGQLAAIRDAANTRLHDLEHKDTAATGYKPVTVPGARRQP